MKSLKYLGLGQIKILPDIGIKNVILSCDAICILGIYFTYNKTLNKQYNLDRVLQNFKHIINMWKGRTLSIYGKITILKTLALSKLLYVSSMTVIPNDFIANVKNIMCNFLWNGSHKVKYKVLIDKL